MMPRTLFRYAAGELLRVLCLALGWLVLVGLLVVFLRTRFTAAGSLLGARECLAGLIVVVPYLVGFLLPAAMLAAVISTFGRLSSDNELLAMRASGLSPLSMAAAPLGAGLLASLVILWLNVEGFGYAAAWLTHVEANLDYDEGRLTRAGNSFEVRDGETRMTFRFLRAPDGGPPRVRVSRIDPGGDPFVVEARSFRCVIENRKNRKGKRRRFVDFLLRDVEVVDPEHLEAKASFEEMELLNLEMPGAITRAIIGGGSAMRSSLPENLRQIRKRDDRMADRADDYEERLLKFRRMLAASSFGGGGTEGCARLAAEMYKFPRNLVRIAVEREQLRGEVSRKLAFSFSPLFLALIGIGLGALARRSSKLIGLSLGVLVAALYYGTWVAGKAMAEHELMPLVMAPWVPNLLCLAGGTWLLFRQNRATS
jgi:lipopolysaccharide export LptBFGC system permease protein LptF